MVKKEIIYLTQEGFDSLKKELKELKEKLMYDIAARIKEAREYGDLSENSEYEEAKNEQGRINGRILEIENVLDKAEIIDANDVQSDIARLGLTVMVKNLENNQEKTFKLVNPQEADIFENKVSVESPVGEALDGGSIGDIIKVKTPSGIQQYEIIGVGLK
ncbi:MAG: transcription elongation factor GreA [Thermotogaceae bacterium]|jgi:transcription elongation factor GreA|nr:transcription elongation factor GreA [Thermotogaceae bacterium]